MSLGPYMCSVLMNVYVFQERGWWCRITRPPSSPPVCYSSSSFSLLWTCDLHHSEDFFCQWSRDWAVPVVGGGGGSLFSFFLRERESLKGWGGLRGTSTMWYPSRGVCRVVLTFEGGGDVYTDRKWTDESPLFCFTSSAGKPSLRYYLEKEQTSQWPAAPAHTLFVKRCHMTVISLSEFVTVDWPLHTWNYWRKYI